MLGVWFRFITFRKKFHLCLIKERNDCEADLCSRQEENV